MSDWRGFHGFKGKSDWDLPIMTKFCNHEARPGYADILAHEYNDTPEVLREKVKFLAFLLKKSRACVLYTGAGLSTSAGIGDYASRDAEGNMVEGTVRSPIAAQPTLSHFILAGLCSNNLIHRWIQQNHDGLPQKAGLLQSKLNEIHGAWYDPSNPVVPMSGSLRGDLFNDLLECEDMADLTLSIGTSMCGMNSDRVFTSVGKRAKAEYSLDLSRENAITQSKICGGVIIGIQRTQYDDLAALHIYSRIDEVMAMLAEELQIKIQKQRIWRAPGSNHAFPVRFDKRGRKLSEDSEPVILELNVGATVKLLSGPHEGDVGEVIGTNAEGHYQIVFKHKLKEGSALKRPFQRLLGTWWVKEAMDGTIDRIPVMNI